MFCPRCGRNEFEQVYGGRCSAVCNHCGHYIWCTETLGTETEPDSIPIYDIVEATRISRAYDKRRR